MRRAALIILIFVRVLVQTAEAGTVTLAWDPNTESNLAGYLLSYGTASGQYTITIDVGNVTSYQFSEPSPASRYYLAVRAYTASGAISPYSNEVVTTPNPPLTITGLTANRMSPQSVGTSIVFTAMSAGGIAPHQFKWWIDNGATSTIGQQWSTTNTFTWTPTVPSSTYVIRVWARNATTTADAPDSSAAILTMTFTIAAATSGGNGTGLTGRYYNDAKTGARFTTLVLTRIDGSIDFNWNDGAPAPGVQRDNFSVRWTGQIQVPVTGTYRFATTADDGVRLWVNGQRIINSWAGHAATISSSAGMTLTAGVRYTILLDFYERDALAQIQLRWTPPGQPESVIPSTWLFP